MAIVPPNHHLPPHPWRALRDRAGQRGESMKAILARARRHFTRRHALVFVIALAVYTPAFWWGVPYATAADRADAWGVDDEPPMGPLAQLHDIFNPKPTQNPNLGYPMLHPFMVIGAYTPYIGYLFATGGLDTPTEAFPHGFKDPVRALRVLSLIAHALSVLLAAGIIVAAYEIGRTLFDERAGLWAAAFVLTTYPLFYYARTSNVDVPVLFFTVLAFIPFAKCMMRGVTVARAAWFGTLAGLALAAKEPAFASFIGVPVALLLLASPVDGTAGWKSGVVWRGAGVAVVMTLLAYAIGSGMVIDPDRYWAHVAFVRERSGDALKGAVAFAVTYDRTIDGHVQLATRLVALLRDSLTLPGLLLGAVGFFVALRSARRAAWFSVTAITYMAILFWMARVAQLRYVMPAAFTIAIFAGYAASRTVGRLALAGRAIGAVAAVIGVLRGIDLTYAMLVDSRYDAAAWLRRTARTGDHIEYFGSSQKNPPIEAAVLSARAIRYLGGNIEPDTSANAVQEILDGWRTRAPRFVILIPDYTSRPGEPFARSCPPEIYRQLRAGSAGYSLAVEFQRPALMPWIRRPPLDYPVVNPPILIFERAS